MHPTEWALESVQNAANHNDLVWVEDHYRLLDSAAIANLAARLLPSAKFLVHSNNALRLRQTLNRLEPSASKTVILDQSCTPRDPHLLPQDAKPSDLRPLSAPDWKPLVRSVAARIARMP